MKTRTIVALAVPVGIAKAFITAKAMYVLGVIVALLIAAATAHAGESTEGRMGINGGDTTHLAADARAVNDAMHSLSNNQQFLNGLLSAQRADTNTGSGQALIDSLRSAAGNQVAQNQGYDKGYADGYRDGQVGCPMGQPSDLVYQSVGPTATYALGNTGSWKWGTTLCDH
jgi:hypothetical protein